LWWGYNKLYIEKHKKNKIKEKAILNHPKLQLDACLNNVSIETQCSGKKDKRQPSL